MFAHWYVLIINNIKSLKDEGVVDTITTLEVVRVWFTVFALQISSESDNFIRDCKVIS